jgi:hypothetical protein
MPFVHGLGQRVGNPRPHTDHRGFLDAELHGDGVGSLEADAADVARQPVRILGHDLDGIGTVGLEDAHGPRRANTVAVQKDHDFAHRLLLGPGSENAGGANRTDTIDLAQPVGRRLDYVEDPLAERPHELLGVNGTYAPDHAGR